MRFNGSADILLGAGRVGLWMERAWCIEPTWSARAPGDRRVFGKGGVNVYVRWHVPGPKGAGLTKKPAKAGWGRPGVTPRWEVSTARLVPGGKPPG